MTLVSLVTRERGIQRTRPRPNARGNYVTIRKYATVYSITYPPTDAAYIHWLPFKHPTGKAIGYFDNPPPEPRLIPVGPVAVFETVPQIIGIPPEAAPIVPPTTGEPIQIISSEPAMTPLVTPENLPEGVDAFQPQPFQFGDGFTLPVQIVAFQVFNTTLKIKQVFIKLDDAAAGILRIGKKTTITATNGFKLVPGAGVVINIDDLSDVWLIGTNAADLVDILYFV